LFEQVSSATTHRDSSTKEHVVKAIEFDAFGGPEVLREVDVDKPKPGPGEVLVRVRRVGVNPYDGKVRAGFFQSFNPVTLPLVPGFEIAGVIAELGEGASEFAVGDEVFGWAKRAGYAEYAVGGTLVRKPAGLDWDTAVSLPVATETALRVLRELDIASSETLLVHGASGAVGSIAAQLAVARGLTVIGTGSGANQEYIATLGAIPTHYGAGLVDRVRALAPNGVDAVFDAAGKGALPDSIELRGGTDRIVTIADPKASELGVRMSGGGAAIPVADIAAAAELAESGKLTVTVAATYPLAEAARAHEVVDGGHAGGKVVLVAD
jgi:NADPH:quinone reductase-like Zn-dependent oxidoreductase